MPRHRSRARRARASAASSVRPIAASLEDVFIDLITGQPHMRCVSRFLLAAMLAMPAAASAQPQPTPLTLEEAIAQGLANSRRLAEIEARAEAADFAIAGRHAADVPLARAAGRLHAHQPRARVLRSRRHRPAAASASIPTSPTTFARGSICSGRSTPAAGPTRSSGRRAPSAARSARTSRPPAPICASRSRARSGRVVTARETEAVLRRSLEVATAHVERRPRPARLGADPAQRRRRRPRRRPRASALLALEAANQRAIAEADLRRLTGNDAATARRAFRRPGLARAAAPPSTATADADCRRAQGAPRAAGARAARRVGRLPRRGGRGRPRVRRSRSAAATTTRARTRASSRAAATGRRRGTRRST